MTEHHFAIIGKLAIYGASGFILYDVTSTIAGIVFRAMRDTVIIWANARDAGTKWSEAWKLPCQFWRDLKDQFKAWRIGYSTCAIRNRKP